MVQSHPIKLVWPQLVASTLFRVSISGIAILYVNDMIITILQSERYFNRDPVSSLLNSIPDSVSKLDLQELTVLFANIAVDANYSSILKCITCLLNLNLSQKVSNSKPYSCHMDIIKRMEIYGLESIHGDLYR